LARPDFRATAARRLSEERELSPAIMNLLSSERPGRAVGIRIIPVERIVPNPEQPRLTFDEDTLRELSASIKEHGVLQPILVRPRDNNQFELVAGERRWRATKAAGIPTIPALVEEIIENLQREDLSPLDEAAMYDRMIREHGYSVRRLAQKLGKDKGYLENRLRLADAPDEVRALVSVRKDTLSHAYELLKVEDPKKRKRLAEQVARGELSLVKLRERIEGRKSRRVDAVEDGQQDLVVADEAPGEDDEQVTGDGATGWTGHPSDAPIRDDSLVAAKQQLSQAVEELVGVLRSPDVVRSIGEVDRANLAKYLMIAKLRLENAIAIIRTGDG
jgi:ParB family transcriptional regulator, chromosome partitioning protein